MYKVKDPPLKIGFDQFSTIKCPKIPLNVTASMNGQVPHDVIHMTNENLTFVVWTDSNAKSGSYQMNLTATLTSNETQITYIGFLPFIIFVSPFNSGPPNMASPPKNLTILEGSISQIVLSKAVDPDGETFIRIVDFGNASSFLSLKGNVISMKPFVGDKGSYTISLFYKDNNPLPLSSIYYFHITVIPVSSKIRLKFPERS